MGDLTLFDAVDPLGGSTVPVEGSDGTGDVCPCCRRPFLSDTGKVARDASGTSRDAARMPGKRSQAVRLLRVLAKTGSMNVGVAASLMEVSPNQLATRMLELREAGLARRMVDAAGNRVVAPTPSGGTGEVHEVTEAGLLYLSRLDG